MSARNPRRGYTVALAALIFLALTGTVKSHDDEHHEYDSWYESLKIPGSNTSCCGTADAYGCDDVFTRDGKNYCRITDDRLINRRPPLPLGTEFEIPDGRMMQGKETNGNPTGHNIIFLGSGGNVYCFILSGGI